MTSAIEDHVDHPQGDTWTTWTTRKVTRGPGDREIRETIAKSGDQRVSSQVTTDKSSGREVRGQITQNGDRWSVAKWLPTDQFPDSRLGAEREKQIEH